MKTIEVYNNYSDIGIINRTITYGPEFDMVREFIDYRKERFISSPQKNLAIFIETKVGNTYPDVIFVEYNPEKFYYWKPERNKLKTNDIKVLNYIYSRGKITSKRIIGDLSISYQGLLQSIENLLDSNLVERKENKWRIKDPNQLFGVSKIETVEAKIGKCEEAIQQALVNKGFASESCLLLKQNTIPDEDKARRIRMFGIGVYLYTKEQLFPYVLRAKENRFPMNYHSVYINEYIGRIINCGMRV